MDTFQVTIPTGLNRPILYLDVSAQVPICGATELLGYSLYDGNMQLVTRPRRPTPSPPSTSPRPGW